MSMGGEVLLELLLLDGLNYAYWSVSVLSVLRTMGPQIEWIVDVSISPPNLLTFLIHALSKDVLDFIMNDEDADDIPKDAHLIWTTLKERYAKSKYDDKEHILEKSFEGFSTSSTINEKPQEEEVYGCNHPSEESTSSPHTTSIDETNKAIRGKKEWLIEKMEKLKALTKGHEDLKNSHASLVEKANCELKGQPDNLTSKHVALQEKYDDLSCSHEKLHKGHGIGVISNKKNNSNKDKYKEQSQNKKEGHHVRYCSLKKEEKDRSKSQSKKKWMAHIKCFNCSNVEDCASICPNKVDDKTSLPKKKTRRSKRKCYGCNERGHEIASCKTTTSKSRIKMRRKRRHLAITSNTFATLAGEDIIVRIVPLMTHPPYGNTKALWVPKHLVTNLQGPNMDCVPPSA
ncbi:hypothetical protein PVAP13_3NG076946 [Panicum virgatum]|uniref:CCHC-type domain-containing protein n=1 Tax=Panicum virgatum TaxID=38727 RepID=A0A8T0UEG5_PANVG|nr:hypothetical protein PVAP13_3NG076946 [Panicum virgatum]